MALSEKIKERLGNLETDYWERKKQKTSKLDFLEFFGQNMSEEQRNIIKAENEVWYSPNAVMQRGVDYKNKVWRESDDKRPEMKDIKALVREAGNGFARQYKREDGTPKAYDDLPHFQKKGIKAMAMCHLGYEPKDRESLSMGKGLFISGNSQIGKTSLFKYLRGVAGFDFRIVTSYDLVAMANNFQNQKMPIDSIVKEYGSKGKYLLIDEVGMGGRADFGKDIIPQIIHMRYGRDFVTHYTSNKSIEDLYDRYEEHIVMRIKQGCNLIETYAQPFLK